MDSEEIKKFYIDEYKKIITEYMPEASSILEKIAKEYDLSTPTAKNSVYLPGRREFISKITSMVSSFIGPVETSNLEKELNNVKH